MSTPSSIYVCHEPEQRYLAERIDGWTRTEPEAAVYDRRAAAPPGEADGELLTALRECLAAADVIVCVVSLSAADDVWIDWELRAARSGDPVKPLVGVLLHEFNPPPSPLVGVGAMLVPFKRDTVDRAIRWAFDMKATSDDYTLKDF